MWFTIYTDWCESYVCSIWWEMIQITENSDLYLLEKIVNLSLSVEPSKQCQKNYMIWDESSGRQLISFVFSYRTERDRELSTLYFKLLFTMWCEFCCCCFHSTLYNIKSHPRNDIRHYLTETHSIRFNSDLIAKASVVAHECKWWN